MEEQMVSDEATMRIHHKNLECSICLEYFRRPRSLPCLHTFCEDCLSFYIIQNNSSTTGFDCPVCRKEITSLDPSIDRKLWAKAFPLNSLLDEMSQKSSQGQQNKIKVRRPSFCNPCCKKGSKIAAVYWCNVMKSAFCKDCKINHHDLIHEGCGLTITDKDSPKETPFETCKKHYLIMDFFCEDHKSLYCSKCVVLMHRHCISVKPAKDYSHALRAGPNLKNMKYSIQKAFKAMNFIVDGSNQMMQVLDLKKQTALGEIRSLRHDIDGHLNNLQTMMEQELTQVHQEEHSKLQEGLKLHTSILNRITHLNDALKSKEMMEDDLKTISVYEKCRVAVEQCHLMVDRARGEWQRRTVEHKVDFDRNNLQKHFSLGKVTTSAFTKNLPIFDNLEVPFLQRRVVDESNFKIQCTGEIDCYATGVLFMSDSRIIVADHNNKSLKMFTEDGTYIHHILLHHAPWGICHHSKSQIAISMTGCNFIAVVRVGANSLKLLYEHEIDNLEKTSSVYGISHPKDTFYLISDFPTYGRSPNKNVLVFHCKYSLYCAKRRCASPLLQPESSSLYMVYDHQRKDIVFSSTSKNGCNASVCRFSKQKQVQSIAMADILKGTHGVDIDKEGNVYACGNASHNIVQISPTGDGLRELLSAEDGVRHPLDISMHGNRFAVTFDSWDRRNHIYIYHLDI